MSDAQTTSQQSTGAGAERHSVLFARLVLQLADLAMVMMGRVPNPQTGQTHRDFEAAQMFIDQLEMLECKTRGNLLPEEARLLRDTLMQLRLSFVDAVEEAGSQQVSPSTPAGTPEARTPPEPTAATATNEPPSAPESTQAPEGEPESRRRFFKKYDV